MAFGKVGRPPKDRVAQQNRIFEAVAPLIVGRGVERLSMQEVAAGAALSVGGLYHYFPTKREVVLHGLSREAGERLSLVFDRQAEEFPGWSHERCLNAYLDQAVRRLGYLHPSVQAGLELGLEGLRERIEAGLARCLDELRATLDHVARGVGEAEREVLVRAVRRVANGALLEREVRLAEVREQLRAVVKAYVTRRGPGLAL